MDISQLQKVLSDQGHDVGSSIVHQTDVEIRAVTAFGKSQAEFHE